VGLLDLTAGGSDPTKLFGRLKAEKVGSLPPVLVVRPLLLWELLTCIHLVLNGLQPDGVKTVVQEKLKRGFLTFFTGDSRTRRFCYAGSEVD
jgi:hypothetical protein